MIIEEANNDYEKFSVLMSVYNGENNENFSKALESILDKQTLKPNEFVLIVDGVINEKLDIVIKNYKKKYPSILKVYRLKENVGLGKALNYGLSKCEYNIIVRADSDDINIPNRFKLQMEKFKQDSSIDVLGGNIDEFNENYNKPINVKNMPLTHLEIVKMAKTRNPINHMTFAFKKHIIENSGAYKHLPYLEDYYLWIRVILNGGKFENLNQCLVHARVGNGMLERRSNKQLILSWKFLNKYMKDNNIIGEYNYLKNMILRQIFIYIPIPIKKIIYNKLLRN
ncbi:glycosyltransferase [Clostridium perfringens]|nr:glycosyltransferase [Clostridium perfringens]